MFFEVLDAAIEKYISLVTCYGNVLWCCLFWKAGIHCIWFKWISAIGILLFTITYRCLIVYTCQVNLMKRNIADVRHPSWSTLFLWFKVVYYTKEDKTAMIFGILTDKLKLSGNAPTGLNPNNACWLQYYMIPAYLLWSKKITSLRSL